MGMRLRLMNWTRERQIILQSITQSFRRRIRTTLWEVRGIMAINSSQLARSFRANEAHTTLRAKICRGQTRSAIARPFERLLTRIYGLCPIILPIMRRFLAPIATRKAYHSNKTISLIHFNPTLLAQSLAISKQSSFRSLGPLLRDLNQSHSLSFITLRVTILLTHRSIISPKSIKNHP